MDRGDFGLSLQIYLISSWSGWWGGASFGNRFFISSYPWLALGLAASLRRIGRKWPRSPTLVVVLLSLWNGGLIVQYGLQLVPRSGAVSWIVVLTNQFSAVPTWLLERIGSDASLSPAVQVGFRLNEPDPPEDPSGDEPDRRIEAGIAALTAGLSR